MATGFIIVPPDSTGKSVETAIPNAATSLNREVQVIGNWASTAAAVVTSSGGLQVTISSGIVTLSSNPTVVSASSGLIQLTSAIAISSGTVTLSSSPTVVSASSGLIQLTSAISLSSGTVTLSSAPSVVSASSGLVQVLTSGTLIVVSASSGLVQMLTSGNLLVVTASSGYLIYSLSSGTVTLSSNPTVISASSGLIQLTSAPVVQTASSGTVATIPSSSLVLTPFTFSVSSSNSITCPSTAAKVFYGWNVGNQMSGLVASIKVYNTTSAGVGSTTNLLINIPIPGSTAGAGNNFMIPQGVGVAGFTFTITASFASTSTGIGWSAGDVVGTFYYV